MVGVWQAEVTHEVAVVLCSQLRFFLWQVMDRSATATRWQQERMQHAHSSRTQILAWAKRCKKYGSIRLLMFLPLKYKVSVRSGVKDPIGGCH